MLTARYDTIRKLQGFLCGVGGLNRMRKRVIVLGSTGSIGQSTLEVLANMSDDWEVVGLAAGSRWQQLADQANRFRPTTVAIADGGHAPNLRGALAYKPALYNGQDALVELVDNVPCDCVVCAVVGADGLAATMRAVELGRQIALANKEALVIAGALIIPLARRTGATIIPVDSEHSAILQAMQAGRLSEVRKVYLTASGGPFRTWSAEAIDKVTVKDTLRHPTWQQMGPKVTIDSATMMNKALEIVEAKWLFDLDPSQIEVVVHPESIIHSLVEFCDGSFMAQLGTPDMRTPIQYALTYPKRRACPSKPLDLFGIGQLNFHKPDMDKFPALRLGYDVAARGGTSGAVLNAANEAAVELFSRGLIHYRDIALATERALAQLDWKESPTLDELLAADRWARKEVNRCTAC